MVAKERKEEISIDLRMYSGILYQDRKTKQYTPKVNVATLHTKIRQYVNPFESGVGFEKWARG